MKKRFNLSVNEDLFAKLKSSAKKENVTVNLLIIDVLQDLYFESSPINYGESLNKLIEETKELSNNT